MKTTLALEVLLDLREARTQSDWIRFNKLASVYYRLTGVELIPADDFSHEEDSAHA